MFKKKENKKKFFFFLQCFSFTSFIKLYPSNVTPFFNVFLGHLYYNKTFSNSCKHHSEAIVFNI
jgi:hypothetical protein